MGPAGVGAEAGGGVWEAGTPQERHLQIYLEDPLLGRLVNRLGWDGAFPPTDDFLAVVDMNIWNKANLVTDERLDYRVQIAADGAAKATLLVTHVNRGTRSLGFPTEQMPFVHQATYDALVRAYVPLGSERIYTGAQDEGSGDHPEPDMGRTVFGDWVSVPAESEHVTTIAYRLPNRRVDDGRIQYDLLVRKQAGTTAVPLRLTVTGPEGWRASGEAGRATGHEWVAETALDVDRQFSVRFERP